MVLPAGRVAVLLMVLAVAAGPLCGAEQPRWVVLEDDPNTPVTYECLVPGPTFGDADAAPAVASGAAKARRAAAYAAAVTAAKPQLRAAGARVTGSYGRQISALMTPKQARKAKASGACQVVYRSYPMRPTPPSVQPEQQDTLAEQQVANTISLEVATAAAAGPTPFGQGVRAMGIDAVRALRPGLLGAGIKIGILSDSYFRTCTRDTCIFPPNCDAVKNAQVVKDSEQDGVIDEGRAMAELICDVAPQAELYFYTAWDGEADFASGIRELARLGCSVIVDDIGYISDPIYSPGVIAQAVNDVHAQGVAYFSAAGNSAGEAWEGSGSWIAGPSYVRGSPSFLVDFPDPPNAGQTFLYHDFGTASRYFLEYEPPSSDGVFGIWLHWDEPSIASTMGLRGPLSDLEMVLCVEPTLSGTCINLPSDNVQTGLPREGIGFSGVEGVTLYVAIRLVSTTRTDDITMKLLSFYNKPAAGQGSASQGASTCYGQPNAEGAMAVGAAFYRNTPAFNGGGPATPEAYTSWGGQRLFMDAQGVRLPQPVDLKKPDIVAPDGTDTTFFYAPSWDAESNGLPNFFGTSAAAPHAAAVAALMRQQWPDIQPNQLYERMRSNAVDMLTPGYDVVTGPGYIDGARLLLGCSAANVGGPCDDGDVCTSDDTCQADFTCVGRPCVATSSCQTAVCDPEVGCSYSLKPDGASCVFGGNTCSIGTCRASQCTRPRAAPDGAPCDDGDQCTTNDACRMTSRTAGKCVGRRKSPC